MFRLTTKLLGVMVVSGFAVSLTLGAVDDDVCARLFARLGRSGEEVPAKKKASAFTPEEIDRICNERACLKHFPWPKGEFLTDEGAKKAVSTERMGEIASSIRAICTSWVKDKATLVRNIGDLSPQERLTLRMLQSGTDPEQLALFGELMYVLKLRKDRNYEKIVEIVKEIRKTDPLRVEAAPRDELEDSTYYTKETLRCKVTLIEYEAKGRMAGDDARKLLPVVAGLLDDWKVLQYQTDLAGDPRDQMLRAVGSLRAKLVEDLHINGDYWKHTAALEEYPAVAGVLTKGESLVLYLRGQENQVHALSIAPSGRVSQLTPDQAAKAFNAVTLKEMREDSTKAMKLFRVLPAGEGYALTLPDNTTYTLTRADYNLLSKGEKLPADHPLAVALAAVKEDSLALYTHPLMQKTGLELTAAKDITFALQRAYPETRIYHDPLSPKTSDRAKDLSERSLRKLDDLLVLVADDSFRVPQNATVKNIVEDLTTLGIKPSVFAGEKYTGPTGRTVIVITGHTSEQLAKYVRQLGEAGYLKDNFIIFNSCESQLTDQLLTEMTTRYGAAAAFAHEKKIGIDNVQQYLLDFVKEVKAKEGLNLFKLLIETLRKNKLNGVWNICRTDVWSLAAC